MSWFLVALLGYGVFSVVVVLDKFILTKSVPKAAVFVFYTGVFFLPLWLLAPFIHLPQNLLEWVKVFLPGAFFILGLWALYLSFQKSEISHVGPLNGASTALFSLLFSIIFLGDKFSCQNLIAAGLLILGSIIISYEQSKEHMGWHKGMLWGVLAGFLSACYYVGSKWVYADFDFFSGLVLVAGCSGLCILPLFLFKDVRDIFKKKKIKNKKVSQPLTQVLLVGADKGLSVIGQVLVQYAVAIGPVALVNSLQGFEYGLLIILVAVLSKYRPKLFKEDYTKFEIYQEVSAVILIAAGLVLLVKF